MVWSWTRDAEVCSTFSWAGPAGREVTLLVGDLWTYGDHRRPRAGDRSLIAKLRASVARLEPLTPRLHAELVALDPRLRRAQAVQTR